MMFLLASLLAIGIQAYSPGNAPIQWVRSQTKNHAKPLVIAPKGFAGHSWDLFTPQKLTLRDTSDKVSPDTIPYFSVMLDESIVWGAKGWCIGTDANRDVVVDHCTGVPAQKWKWIPDGLGRNRIQLKNTNWCLAAGNDAGLNGTPVVLRDCQSRKTEMWKFEEPIALPTPVTVLNHVFSSHIRHVLVSLLALAGVGALAFGAWFWQRSTKKTCCVALSQGSVPAGVERREGVLVSTFFATNTKRDQLVEEQDANNELSQQKQSRSSNYFGGCSSASDIEKHVGRREKLEYVKFGNTDMMVSEVCAGTMMWGSFIEHEDVAWDQLDALIRLGVNFLDTAEMYPVGWNYGETTEKWIGNWLAKRSAEGRIDRKNLYIATKVNCSAIGTPPMPGREMLGVHAFDEDVVWHACKSSIERLQCEYIDLYQLHWPCRDTPVFGCAQFYAEGHNRPMPFVKGQGGIESFEKQVMGIKKLFDAGLIRHWGLSNENAYGITMFCMACDKLGVPRPVSCQNDFSLLNRTYEGDTWEAAYRLGVVGLPYGVMAGGVLSGKYLPGSKYANLDPDRPLSKCRHEFKPDFQPRYAWPSAMLATEKYSTIAESWGLTPAELALAWARDRQCNGAVLIGSCSVKQVEDSVNAFKLEKLPQRLMDEVDTVFEEFRNPTQFYAIKEAAGKVRAAGVERKADESV